jgi:hypothetical protein
MREGEGIAAHVLENLGATLRAVATARAQRAAAGGRADGGPVIDQPRDDTMQARVGAKRPGREGD